MSSRLLIVLILLSSGAMLGAGHSEIGFLADSVDAIGPDQTRQARVDNLLLERAGASFLLEKGVITLSEAIRGRAVGASFVGKGRFQMTPPNRVERFALAKLCRDSTADWEFEKALFLFTDSTAGELVSKLQFDSLDAKVNKHFDLYDRCIKYIEKEFKSSFPAWVLPGLLQPSFPGSFVADFECKRGRLFFIHEPNEVEEVQLWKYARTGAGSYPELVTSFHSPDQYQESNWGPEHEDKDRIDSLEYDLDVEISQSCNTRIAVELSFVPKVEGVRSLCFRIFPKLVRESVTVRDVVGDTLYWDKLKDEGTITVYFNEPLRRGVRAGLKFEYSSKRLIQQTPWGSPYLAGPTTWYPRYGHLTRAKHRLRFSCPEHYTMLSVGDKLSERVENDRRVTEWDASAYPLAVVSFNYGAFERDTAMIYGGIPLEVYGGKTHGAFSSKLREAVLMDLASSASIFSAELAPYPFEKLWATEIPAAHSQGLPGLIHLAWASFDDLRAGYTEASVAHEVAHQWWGHMVGWDSYHDQWLSEGFAEYMAAWYIKSKYKDSKLYSNLFLEMIEDWREDIYESGGLTKRGRSTGFSKGNDAGPIWLGRRLESSASSDYFPLVYSKGAYVVYMLRMLMYDFVDHDESRFIDMLKDFLASYYWQEAATSDFIRIAEKHYGSGLGWFFDQYVYDTQIPNYLWRTEFSDVGNGRYEVTFDIETRDVGEDFEMLVPVTIGMENDYHTTTRLKIDALHKRITLPTLPYRPQKVIFNTHNSVLCKSRQVD